MTSRPLDIPLEVLAPSVEEIASICDLETALLLVEHFGGCRFWVPKEWREGHELNIIGEDRAKALITKLGGDELSMPMRPYTSEGLQIMIAKLGEEGHTQRQIAQRLHIAQRTVRDICRRRQLPASRKKAAVKDTRQTDLEDYLKSA